MIYETINKISCSIKNTLMYGIESSHFLECVIKGYYISFHIYDKPLSEEEKAFGGFGNFIKKKYNITHTQDWGRTIRFFSKSDEESLTTFYTIFQEFLSLPNICTEEYDEYIKDIISPLDNVSEFNQAVHFIVSNKHHYRLNSVVDLDNLLLGISLGIQDLSRAYGPILDDGYNAFWQNRDAFANFISQELDVKPVSNFRLMLIGYYYPRIKSIEGFYECYKKFLNL